MLTNIANIINESQYNSCFLKNYNIIHKIEYFKFGNRQSWARIPAQSKASFIPQKDFKFFKNMIILFKKYIFLFHLKISLYQFWINQQIPRLIKLNFSWTQCRRIIEGEKINWYLPNHLSFNAYSFTSKNSEQKVRD